MKINLLDKYRLRIYTKNGDIMYDKKMFEGLFDRLFLFEKINSTNEFLKNCTKENAICLSDCQTNGKGRLGRSFQSDKGKGIYISFLLSAKDFGEDLSSVTAFSAVEVCRAIFSVCKVMPKIKWVNDLLINQKKICGILTEMRGDKIILGIGINVINKKEDFEEEIQNKAASIKMQTGKEVKREDLVLQLIKNIDKMAENVLKDRQSYVNFYKENCITLNKEVTVTEAGAEKQGTVCDINPDFSLTVEFSDKTQQKIFCGEAIIRNLY